MSSFPRPKLVDHTLDLGGCGTRGLGPEEFQGVEVLRLLRLFSRLHNHSALYPHFNSLGRRQVGALWHES